MHRAKYWVRGGIALFCLVVLSGSSARAQNTADVVGHGDGHQRRSTARRDGDTHEHRDEHFPDHANDRRAATIFSICFKSGLTPLRWKQRDSRPSSPQPSTVQPAIARAWTRRWKSATIDDGGGAGVVSSGPADRYLNPWHPRDVAGVEDLPLDGRNIMKLVQLSAGTTEGIAGFDCRGHRPDDRRQTSAFSVNGQADRRTTT